MRVIDITDFALAGKLMVCVLFINFILLGVKIYIYSITASLAVLAYIIDTLMDMLNDAMAIYAVRLASRPADIDHPYGHGKYDAFVSVLIAMFIVLGAIEIFIGTAERILGGYVEIYLPREAIISFVVLGTVYVGIGIIEYLYSSKLGISVMEASASHYLTDPLYTIAVFLGVYFASIGYIVADYIVSTLIAALLLYGAINIIRTLL